MNVEIDATIEKDFLAAATAAKKSPKDATEEALTTWTNKNKGYREFDAEKTPS